MALVSRLPEIARNLRDDVPAAMAHAAGHAIVSDARRRIHPETTELGDSLHVVENEHGFEVIADARDPEGTPYGKFVEFGTHHASPHPFLLPALAANAATVAKAADAGIKEACR